MNLSGTLKVALHENEGCSCYTAWPFLPVGKRMFTSCCHGCDLVVRCFLSPVSSLPPSLAGESTPLIYGSCGNL